MNSQPETSPTSDERLMAALAYFFGLVVALILWATQKDKSRFVRFQAVQAMSFDATILLFFIAGFACVMLLMIGTSVLGIAGAAVISGAEGSGEAGPLASLFFLLSFLPVFAWCPLVLCMFAAIAARLIAAISVLQGRDFRYPILGARLEKFLG